MYRVLLDNLAIHDPSLNDPARLLVNGVVTKKVNCADNFTFTIYPGNAGYDSLVMLNCAVSVYKDGQLIFHGRPLSEETGWDNEKTVVCEGDLAIFNDTVVRPYEYDGTVANYLRFLVNQHNAQTTADKQVILRTVTVTDPNDRIIRSHSDYVSTMQELMDKTVGHMGGYLMMSYEGGSLYLDYLADSTSGTNQALAVGKNILDFQRSLSAEALATALVPLGAKDEETGERVTIKSVNEGQDYIQDDAAVSENGLIFAIQTWDDVTVPANLLRKAQAVLTDLTRVLPRIQLTAIDLTVAGYDMDAIGFFEYVTVTDTAHHVSGQYLITERQYCLSAPENDKVTFGGEEETISGQTAKTRSELPLVGDSILNTAISIIEHQTELLKGGAGGYVVIGTDEDGHPSEIYFMDTDSRETARSVLRINQNGIGFSTSGFEGPYTNAWTIDGHLNASFMHTGTLQDTATGGQKFYLNLNTGEVRLESLDIVAQKVDNIGGRNLIVGTLNPAVTPAEKRPHILGQMRNTDAMTDATWSAADITVSGIKYGHGFRVTNTTSVRPYIRFGSSSVSSGSMNGLVAGKTYIFSARCQFKLLSNYSGSDSYEMRAALYTDAANPGNSFAASAYEDFFMITPALAGATRAKNVTFTFTVPAAATMAYLVIRCRDSTAADYGDADYIDLRNIKLEEGMVATAWSPAPEDQEEYTNAIFTVASEAITAEVTRATGAENALSGRITTTAEAITAEVTRATGAETALSGRITTTADAITAEVTRAKGAETALSGRIDVEAGKIALVVDGSGNIRAAQIVASINDAGSSVVIDADHISLAGSTIDLTSDTIQISSSNFSVDSTGNITAKSGTIGGWLIEENKLSKTKGNYTAGIAAPDGTSTSTLAFYIRDDSESTPAYPFMVRYDGRLTATNATISGDITANSLTLGSGVSIGAGSVSGLASVATSGRYSDLSGAPDLTLYVAKDGTIGGTPGEGVTGFQVSSAGLLQASNAVIYGNIYASGGKIGGWNIASGSINSTSSVTEGTAGIQGRIYLQPGAATYGIRMQTRTYDGSTYGAWTNQFYVNYEGKVFARNAEITGKITATSGEIAGSLVTAGINANNITAGTLSADRISVTDLNAFGATIGGWSIGTATLYKDSGDTYRVGLSAPTNPSATTRAIYIKKTESGTETYPFYVRYDGKLIAANVDIAGKITATSGSISGSLVTSGISADNITAGTLNVDRINANSIDVGKLTGAIQNGNWKIDLENETFTVGNLSAANITTGTLSADRIGANSISVGKLTGSITNGNWKIDLNAGTFTIGEITADKVAAGTMSGANGDIQIGSGGWGLLYIKGSSGGGIFQVINNNSGGGYISTARNEYGNLAYTGYTQTASQSAVSCDSGTVKNLASVYLSGGKWIVTATASFETNGTGRRHISLTDSNSSIAAGFPQSSPAISGVPTYLTTTGYFNVTGGMTVYLNGLQNSGGALTASNVNISAICIA